MLRLFALPLMNEIISVHTTEGANSHCTFICLSEAVARVIFLKAFFCFVTMCGHSSSSNISNVTSARVAYDEFLESSSSPSSSEAESSSEPQSSKDTIAPASACIPSSLIRSLILPSASLA